MSPTEAKNDSSAPPAPIKRRLPRYVHVDKSRHGITVYYFRPSRNVPRIRIRGEPGTKEFDEAVVAARTGAVLPPASWVYFARSGNRVKIGVSKNPRARLEGLRTGSSTKIRIYYVTPGDITLERELHRQFGADRINGEWFIYSPQIRAWIQADEARRTRT